MSTVADDLQEPDETRPAKRVRLEAPLGTTEEMEEEMIDDEDLYGTDAEGGATNTIVGEPGLNPPVAEDVEHALPNTITMSDSDGLQAVTNDTATPNEAAMDTEDFYGEGKAETADGLPAEAIDHGEDDFVAPPQHVDGEDGVQAAVTEEMSHVEVDPPVISDTPHGEQKASQDATQQKEEVIPPQSISGAENTENSISHIAPERTRETVAEQDAEEEDFYGGLESAIQASSASVLETNGAASAPKPKDDLEFLEAAAAQKGSESAEWQFDSSDAESSDSSDSSDSDSDSESESEDGYEMLDAETTMKILMQGDGEDGEGKEKTGGGSRGPRTQNEIKDEIQEKPDVTITEDMKITLLGTVDRVVENMALIKGATPGEYQVLESGSVLCNASREVIGAVADTFGRVQEPLYSVVFGSAKDIEDTGMQHGAQVYYVDQHSTFVFTQPLKGQKGTDASNIHDEEVGEDEIEFSDDEKEAEYKRMKKAAKRGGRGGLTRTDFNNAPQGRGGMHTFGAPGHDSGQTFVGGASDAPQSTYGGGMSYDDDDAEDDFYQPLKRPDNLSELMAGRRPPTSERGGFDRGRGRGRGRGDRGRGDRGRGRGGNQRGQRGGGFGGDNVRGGHEQGAGHRGAARSFPDRHNNNSRGRGRGPPNLPAKPHAQQSPTPPQSSPQQQNQQYPVYPPAQPQHQPPTPQTYNFNGYTFQYGMPPPAQYQQPPQQYHQGYANYSQQSSPQQHSPGTAQYPAGAYVNPAFFQGGQQQAQQYGGWGGQAQQFAQPQAQWQGQGQGQGQGQQQNVQDILKVLSQAGQGRQY